MPGPWEQYQTTDSSDQSTKPWEKYSSTAPSTGGQVLNLITMGEFGKAPEPGTNPRFDEMQKYIKNTRLGAALTGIGMAGKAANDLVQRGAGYIQEQTGRASAAAERAGYPNVAKAIQGESLATTAPAAILSEMYLPKTPFQAGLTIAGAGSLLEPGPKVDATGWRTPTKLQRWIAEVASVQSNVKPNQIAAVMANPDIMGPETPSTREVGKEFQKVFDELGFKFDGKTYQEIIGMRYPPNETQASRLKDIVSMASQKLEAMKSAEAAGQAVSKEDMLTPAEAFLARSAGKKVMTGTVDAATKRLVGQDVDAMDSFLENNGIPEIKELGHKYFRAATKEALSEAIPKLRNGKPAVVRSMLMAHYGAEAIQAAAEGKPLRAAIQLGTGAAMSPAVQGVALPFMFGPTNPTLSKLGVMASPQLKALQDYQSGQ